VPDPNSELFEQVAEATRPQVDRSTDRSPNYPLIDLGEAIEYARKCWEKFKRSAVPVSSVTTQAWGLSVKSSGGRMTVSALVKFGLLEESGRGAGRTVRVSELAQHILIDQRPESEERAALIRQAALTPRVHRELWDKWGASLPPDHDVRFYLMKELKFTTTGADDFANEYKATLAFAKMAGSDTRKGVQENGATPREVTPPPAPHPTKMPAFASAGIAPRVAQDQAMTNHHEAGQVPPGDSRFIKPPPPAGLATVEDVLNLPEGQIVLRWPREISARSAAFFERWVALMVEKVRPVPPSDPGAGAGG
jgi:hypothetical protein